ncbi:PPC domain-containing DNA-binding protein [Chelatococcus reniformis]|uniref:PPC domain-containing protein n=1 Tax=Chelatococcus reniformis TaxID=1494448 RepID=A0A916XJ25_9HYPH|nr:PPC domain-containing DNA-binding protein [Chelatococcus reniformis]GGC75242.1 hypothetical protein GCM10010994_37110 [Chelatococcus reniformis]
MAATTDIPRFVSTPTGFLLVLRQGDDAFAALERLTSDHAIPAASFMGFGFAGEVTFGFFDAESRQYQPRTFHDVELASMTGSLAWKDGRPSIHAHGVAGRKDFAAVGGHLLGLKVGTGSLEITVIVHDQRLERATDAAVGANVLQLPEHRPG